VTRKLRRHLNSTGKQNCEICQEQTYLIQHHIAGRKIKKANKHNNLANICSNCHIQVHKGEIIIEKRIMTTAGFVLLWHKRTEESITGEDSFVYTF
jgi:Zn-finger protein